MHKGISLVELVVSVGIIALLGVMGTSLLFGALRGSRKANAVINTQDEGTYAVNIVTSLLRYARDINSCAANKVTYVARINETPTSFSCETGYLASGSARLTSSGVNVTGCSITCDSLLRQVNIKFTVSAIGAVSNIETASANFDTQVVLRNKE